MSRSLHDEMMLLVNSQVSDLKHERKILLDRLATIGLGGPLFNSPSPQDSSPNMAQEEESISEEEAELAHINRLKRKPSTLAAYLTHKMARDARKLDRGPSVARMHDLSKVNAALDAAEELGKKQA